MNVIDYITITCNLQNVRLQITSDYMKKCNRLQRLQLRLPHVWQQLVETPIGTILT
jgi:hypothetical protein